MEQYGLGRVHTGARQRQAAQHLAIKSPAFVHGNQDLPLCEPSFEAQSKPLLIPSHRRLRAPFLIGKKQPDETEYRLDLGARSQRFRTVAAKWWHRLCKIYRTVASGASKPSRRLTDARTPERIEFYNLGHVFESLVRQYDGERYIEDDDLLRRTLRMA
jgi:hypothetical protein